MFRQTQIQNKSERISFNQETIFRISIFRQENYEEPPWFPYVSIFFASLPPIPAPPHRPLRRGPLKCRRSGWSDVAGICASGWGT